MSEKNVMRISDLASLMSEVRKVAEAETREFLKLGNIKNTTKIGDEFEGVARLTLKHSLPDDLFCFPKIQITYGRAYTSHAIDLVVAKSSDVESFPNSSNGLLKPDALFAAFEVKKSFTSKSLSDDLKKLIALKKDVLRDFNSRPNKFDYHDYRYAGNLFDSSVVASLERNGQSLEPLLTPLQKHLFDQYLLAPHLPFTAFFGFERSLSKKSVLQALISSISNTDSNLWPDLVVCGDIAIVRFDERPYSNAYCRVDKDKVEDLCLVFGIFESDSYVPFLEHLDAKLSTSANYQKTSTTHSDTIEEFYPCLALATVQDDGYKRVVIIAVDADEKFSYPSDETTMRLFIDQVSEE